MKTIRFLTILTLLCAVLQFTSAQSSVVTNDIAAALSAGDVNKLGVHFNSSIELVVDSKSDVYSKQQAIGILSDFFRKNPVKGFQNLHSGNKDASNFMIGTLKTATGNFRVYLVIRKTEGKLLIQQLRIEAE